MTFLKLFCENNTYKDIKCKLKYLPYSHNRFNVIQTELGKIYKKIISILPKQYLVTTATDPSYPCKILKTRNQ